MFTVGRITGIAGALFAVSFLGCGINTAKGVPLDPGSNLQGDEKRAWNLFNDGVEALQEKGDRRRAAECFEQVVAHFPQSRYASDAKDLAKQLRPMIQEDLSWREPSAPTSLPFDQKISYYIYHLRDVKCYQYDSPGMCNVLAESFGAENGNNSAIKLKEIGAPAIKPLIQLLRDRRPTRSVGYWRIYMPARTVLRYQDAAIQILNELLPVPFYQRSTTSSYFSNENSAVQERVIHLMETWYKGSLGPSSIEGKWLAVKAGLEIDPLIDLLRSLATEPGQEQRVLITLREMCAQRDPVQLPPISNLMCELGDSSQIDSVLSAYVTGKYRTVNLKADSLAGIRAEQNTRRQVLLYGSDAQRDALMRAYDSYSSFNMLVQMAEDGDLPAKFDRDRFPLGILVGALSKKEVCGGGGDGKRKWTIRWCDQAAGAIQRFTHTSFAFDATKPDPEKDAAIAEIQAWWKKRSADSREER